MNLRLSRHDQTLRGHFQYGDRGASRMIKRIKKENRIVLIVHKRTRSAMMTNVDVVVCDVSTNLVATRCLNMVT